MAAKIEEIGSGSYQTQQAILMACFFLSEAAELDVISPLTTAWRLQWALVTDDVALLASVGYLGFALGTLLSGPLGDWLGRRAPIFAGYLGVLIGAVGMWSAPTPYVVGFFRAITGFSVGIGIPASLTLVAEVTPAKSRADILTTCYIGLALGELFADLGLYLFMPNLQSGEWRSLCLWSALPAALALPAAWFGLEESPSYYLSRGDYDGVSRVLGKMAEKNGKPGLTWKPTQQAMAATLALQKPGAAGEGPFSSYTGLQPYASPLVACASLDFAYNFVLFGTGYFFPLVLAELTSKTPVPPIAELFIASLLAIPSLVIGYNAVSSEYGHRQVLIFAGGVEAAASLCLLATSVDYLPVFGIFVLKIMMSSYTLTVNSVKSELFPSKVRVTALSVSGTSGRIGALLAPALIEETRGSPGSPDEFNTFIIVLVAVLVSATSLGIALLPETKRAPLPE